MIGTVLTGHGGRAFAGLALVLGATTACQDEGTGRGPDAPTQGEEAALKDAAAMLEEREPAENANESEPDEAEAE